MRKESSLLLRAVKAEVWERADLGVGPLLKGSLDWAYVLRAAHSQGILPHLFHHLSTQDLLGLIPYPYAVRLRGSYAVILHRNSRLAAEMQSILSSFRREGVQAIPLKGPVLAELLYGDLALRPTSDLDLLVRREDMPAARRLLAGLGYLSSPITEAPKYAFHDPPYCKPSSRVFVDLHWSLVAEDGPPFAMELLWRRAQPQLWRGQEITVLSPEDNLLFLAHHLPRHSTGLLKLLCDVGKSLRKYQGVLDWPYIQRAAEGLHWKGALYLSLSRAQSLLKVPVPPEVLLSTRPSVLRRWPTALLVDGDTFTASPPNSQLRGETVALVLSLTEDHLGTAWHTYFKHLRSWRQKSFVMVIRGLGLSLLTVAFHLFRKLEGTAQATVGRAG